MPTKQPGEIEGGVAVALRRGILRASLIAPFMAFMAKPAMASQLTDGLSNMNSNGKHNGSQANDQLDNVQNLLGAFAVSQLILRERLAREIHNYDEEEACYYPDAPVEVSWFKGTAADFVDAGRKTSAAGENTDSAYFDSLGPASILVHNDRAITDSACAIHTFLPLDGVQASMTSFTRLLSRVRKSDDKWRIAGLRAIYIRDQLEPCNPAQVPKIDLAKLNKYRLSYRHLSYALEANGRPLRDDLPGVDRPELVSALRAADREWLYSQDA
jgi:hypothetical protein